MTRSVVAAIVLSLAAAHLSAQGRGAQPPQTARAMAPIDLTGYWTAVISEDWHTRMLTAARGDFGSGQAGTIENPGLGLVGGGPNPSAQGNIPYRAAAAKLAMNWDPAKDEADGNACKGYGAPAIMRLPTHLHITWQDDNTLKVDADYGTQTRLFHFAPPVDRGRLDYTNGTLVPPQPFRPEPPPGTEPSWQGYSIAQWTIVPASATVERGGNLKVMTTRLKPGYYWKNGMPYTGNAVLTEYFRTMELPDKSQWIRLTQIVEDSEYLTQPWVVNYGFRKLPNGAKWTPTPCSVK